MPSEPSAPLHSDASRKVLESIADLLPGFIYQIRYQPALDSWQLTFVGPNIESMFGVTAQQALDDSSALLGRIHPDDQERVFRESREALLSGLSWLSEFRMLHPDGRVLWVQAQDRPHVGADGAMVCTGYINDITERRRLQAEVARMATTDAVTGLANRQAFNAAFLQAIEAADRARGTVGLVFIDLDHFKLVNDRFGHSVGDGLLTQVGARLRLQARAGDIVARMGGDEFLVLLPESGTSTDALMTARRLCAALSEPYEVDGHRLRVSASAGVALYPEHGVNAGALVGAADAAMYRAKASGRGRACMAGPAAGA